MVYIVYGAKIVKLMHVTKTFGNFFHYFPQKLI
jgi:hypothetical protein